MGERELPADSGAHLFGRRPHYRSSAETTIVTVGHGDADIPGNTNLCIQAGVDYVANLGGGTVHIMPGKYIMHDSLHLRTRVTVRGAGESTVLFKAEMVKTPLSADLGYGHYDVSVAEPEKFRPGMGIHIKDDGSGGFYNTCATIIYRDGDRLGINRPLSHDYSRSRNGVVRSLFPIVSGYDAEDASLENLLIDGNAEQNEYLDGCRGGGVFLLRCHRARIFNVIVRNYHGDGFSLQQCEDVLLEDCLAEENKGVGFHPGSGSTRPIMRRLLSRRNGSDGLFYCLRVTFGILEDSEFVGNGGVGLNIGGRDTDQLIRRCTIRLNAGPGLYFRPADRIMAGSRAVVQNCTIEQNCQKEGKAEVHLDAELSGVCLIGNCIRSASPEKPAVLIESRVDSVELKDNALEGSITDLRD